MTEHAPRPWMPFWLASWIAGIGTVACIGIGSLFVVVMVELDVQYIWGCEYILLAFYATPWIWYFAYIRYRYLETVPRLYYLLWGAPFIQFLTDQGNRITLWSYYAEPYYLRISGSDVIVLCMVAIVIYEVWRWFRETRSRTTIKA